MPKTTLHIIEENRIIRIFYDCGRKTLKECLLEYNGNSDNYIVHDLNSERVFYDLDMTIDNLRDSSYYLYDVNLKRISVYKKKKRYWCC